MFKIALSYLELHNFRNHQFFKLDCKPHSVIITGANGMGKTNILEAISLLTSSKGLRGAKIAELTNQEHPDHAWQITACLNSKFGPKEIVTKRNVKPNSRVESRIVQIDGLAIRKKTELAELLSIVWLTPLMQHIFIGPSSARRNFYDMIVANFFPQHTSYLSLYEHATAERLKLLKNNQNDDSWLSAIEQNMWSAAGNISDARMKTLSMLQNSIDQNKTIFPKALLSLEKEPISPDFLNLIRKNRALDAKTGRTNLGSHLFDLQIFYKNKNMPAKFCSTGEQKALLLNLILAQICALIEKSAQTPILLLDEVISHLDATHRQLLFEELLNLDVQCWMTGLDPVTFKAFENNAEFIHLG